MDTNPPQETPDQAKNLKDFLAGGGDPRTIPPEQIFDAQETGIDEPFRQLYSWGAMDTKAGTDNKTQAVKEAAQALLRLFEKEAVEYDTLNTKKPWTVKAVPLSKLRELLGGAE